MAAVVVDSDVISFEFKRDSRARLYDPHLSGKLCIISFMTLAELDRWTLERNWGKARQASLARHLQKFVVTYADRKLCRMWAEVCNRARRNGHPIQTADAWIAATALAADIPLVTHNPDDYAGVNGLSILSALLP